MPLSVQKTVCASCAARFVAAPKGTLLGFPQFVCPQCGRVTVYPLPGAFLGAYGLGALILGVGFFAASAALGPMAAFVVGLLEAAVLFALFKNFQLKKAVAAAEAKPAAQATIPAQVGVPTPAALVQKRSYAAYVLAAAAVLLLLVAGLALRRPRKAAPSAAAQAPAPKAAPAPTGSGIVDWVALPAGGFTMGSESGEASEKPPHPAAVKSFDIARAPVTFGQYKKCVEAGACAPPGVSDGKCMVFSGTSLVAGKLDASWQADELPVVCVDWAQAKAFSEWAGGRLPTEAEWEYAARGAGRSVQYPWGDEAATCRRAVMNEGGPGCQQNGSGAVCSKPEGGTPQGLCDMAGNVSQWVEDWFHDSYAGAPVDGAAWEDPPGPGRVYRGGSWAVGAGALRVSARGRGDPHSRMSTLGFRPAREHPPEIESREGQEAKTRAAIAELRRLLTEYRAQHQGKLPPDLTAFFAQMPEKPLVRLPPYHAPGSDVHLFASLQDNSAPDTGGWGFVGDSRSKDYGSVFVNCTHTDSKGSSWDSY